MLEKVKLSLRISHSHLDEDIKATISTARLELSRSGVDLSKDDEMIEMAIKTYCQYVYAADTKAKDGYLKSFQYQQDCLRKSSKYMKSTESEG